MKLADDYVEAILRLRRLTRAAKQQDRLYDADRYEAQEHVLLDEAKETFKQRILAHIKFFKDNPDKGMHNYDEPDGEVATIHFAEKVFGYDFELDDEAREYFLKATMVEVWEYWLNKILPKINKL